jgi:hypothetical protein
MDVPFETSVSLPWCLSHIPDGPTELVMSARTGTRDATLCSESRPNPARSHSFFLACVFMLSPLVDAANSRLTLNERFRTSIKKRHFAGKVVDLHAENLNKAPLERCLRVDYSIDHEYKNH